MRKSTVLLTTFALAATLSACQEKGASAGTDIITVAANDTACELSATTATTGVTTFKITNSGSKVNEFYVYAAGDRIVGEVENIGAGLTREFKVELNEPGTFTTACKPGMIGDGIRAAFTVTGEKKAGTTSDAKVAAGVAAYKKYVAGKADEFYAKTQEFVTAVKAKDVAKAKALYPEARLPWEEIEPVAETFGDLDPMIDGREDVTADGMKFTGYHRLERDLWVTGLQPDSDAIADKLLADVKTLRDKAQDPDISGVSVTNGAKALLDEVATGKITGEEERYSHTDLWDFYGNLEGTRNAIDVMRPVLAERDPALLASTDKNLTALRNELLKYRNADGTFKLYTQLTDAEIKALSQKLDVASGDVSKLSAVIAK